MQTTTPSCSCIAIVKLPHRDHHVCGHDSATSAPPSFSLGEATLAIAYFMSSLQGELMSDTPTPRSFHFNSLQQYDSVDVLEQTCGLVIATFQSALRKTRNKLDDVCRWYKILQKTMLSQRLGRLRKILDETEELQISSMGVCVIKVCGRLLSSCVVAILRVLIAAEKDEQVRCNHWDAIVDAYSRVIAIYDALDSKIVDSSLTGEGDKLIVEAHETIDVKKPSFASMERFAKLLFSIGKRRHDSKSNAVLPLVHSLQLFTKLESVRSDQTLRSVVPVDVKVFIRCISAVIARHARSSTSGHCCCTRL
jgi:hypothetical protein